MEVNNKYRALAGKGAVLKYLSNTMELWVDRYPMHHLTLVVTALRSLLPYTNTEQACSIWRRLDNAGLATGMIQAHDWEMFENGIPIASDRREWVTYLNEAAYNLLDTSAADFYATIADFDMSLETTTWQALNNIADKLKNDANCIAAIESRQGESICERYYTQPVNLQAFDMHLTDIMPVALPPRDQPGPPTGHGQSQEQDLLYGLAQLPRNIHNFVQPRGNARMWTPPQPIRQVGTYSTPEDNRTWTFVPHNQAPETHIPMSPTQEAAVPASASSADTLPRGNGFMDSFMSRLEAAEGIRNSGQQ
jgi:hypothetical protein